MNIADKIVLTLYEPFGGKEIKKYIRLSELNEDIFDGTKEIYIPIRELMVVRRAEDDSCDKVSLIKEKITY